MESARVLNVRGRVLPSTLENVTLCAHLADGSTVRGESAISHERPAIREVFLEPERPGAYDPALAAILNADLIVLGPGSLFTSVLPEPAGRRHQRSDRWSSGRTVYVCNVATQEGETDHYGYDDHVREIVHYLGEDELDYAHRQQQSGRRDGDRPRPAGRRRDLRWRRPTSDGVADRCPRCGQRPQPPPPRSGQARRRAARPCPHRSCPHPDSTSPSPSPTDSLPTKPPCLSAPAPAGPPDPGRAAPVRHRQTSPALAPDILVGFRSKLWVSARFPLPGQSNRYPDQSRSIAWCTRSASMVSAASAARSSRPSIRAGSPTCSRSWRSMT